MTLRSGHMHPCVVSNASGIALISLCGKLVYNDLTSMVAVMVLGASGACMVKMVCKKLFDMGIDERR